MKDQKQETEKKAYMPNPVDTSAIRLDDSLMELAEKLAENVHEVWARQRMNEGWTYGPHRDDHRKKHPCLIPYEDLPESEKEYDRNTAIETLKGILGMGYTIHPPADNRTAVPVPDPFVDYLFERLSQPAPRSLSELQRIWEKHDPEQWRHFPDLYRMLAERIIRTGEPLFAYDVLSCGLKHFPSPVDFKGMEEKNRDLYVRLHQLLGLSLAQSGATLQAHRILKALYEKGATDGETLGLLGRTCKDMGLAAEGEAERTEHFKAAAGYYQEAYEGAIRSGDESGAGYSGINAATLGLLCGAKKDAEALAQEVLRICMEKAEADERIGQDIDYWRCATIGEAHLIGNRIFAARSWYERAVSLAAGMSREISSMRRQARLLAGHLKGDPNAFDEWFPVPSVAVFLGCGGSSLTSFSGRAEEEIRSVIQSRLQDMNAGIGYASVSEIEDILFLEEMFRRDAEVNIVLPFSVTEVRRMISEKADEPSIEARFDRLVQKAIRVFELSMECEVGNETNIEFASIFMDGMAKLRAKWLDTEIRFLSVQEEGIRGRADSPAASLQAASEIRPSREIYTMLFADIKNYSRMNENQLLLYSRHVLHEVARIIRHYEDHIALKRTAGDGFFLVFNNFIAALQCALDFREIIAGKKWEDYGLPEELSVRISLDAGPVFTFTDPIVDGIDFCGKYVIRAARIEPITPPGEIYASESFAALVTSQNDGAFQFQYAGQIRLAKNYEVARIYHVKPS